MQGEAQPASWQSGARSGTVTGATRSGDSDVQAASKQLGTVFGFFGRRSGLAPAWRRRLRLRARLPSQPPLLSRGRDFQGSLADPVGDGEIRI